MSRPHTAALAEDAWHRWLDRVLRRRGWQTRIISHTGIGSESLVRVMGRALLTGDAENLGSADATASALELFHADNAQRGWRAFITAPALYVPITVTVNGVETRGRADRSGLIDIPVRGHGLSPGWHEVRISAPDAELTTAAVFIVGDDETFGIVSDIDDTIIKTSLPRPMIAAWNTFVRHEGARRAVPGMASMYRALLEDHPKAPIVYLSTGAWNTAPSLTRFLRRNGYPPGPLLLTDWGPTSTGWFRSGHEHKRSWLHRLARELPNVQWVLVGDDGQHDPALYGDFADERPEAVRAIAIRELSTTEQLLQHGIPISNEEFSLRVRHQEGVPVCRAPNGYALLELLRVALGWQSLARE
jgi:phosphatidate phosphatase APP1